MKRLPESPRKIVAGLKLKRRKPRIAPARAMVMTVTSEWPVEQGHDEGDQRREQGGAGGQTVETVNQVERVGDGQDPQDGEGPSDDTRAGDDRRTGPGC